MLYEAFSMPSIFLLSTNVMLYCIGLLKENQSDNKRWRCERLIL